MSARNWRYRLLATIAIASGTTVQAVADDYEYVSPQPVVIEHPYALVDPPVQDPVATAEDSETASESDAVVAENVPEPPVVDAGAPAMAAAVPCTCCNQICCTKKKKEAATAAMKNAYQNVFYANDYSYLRDPCYDGPSFLGDSLKGLMCGRLDIGGEARMRYHSEENHRGTGLTGVDDDFWLTRYRMFANFRATENIRLYGEYLYADSGGENFNNRPIEENRGEIQNLFADFQLTERLSMRLGRQEILLGAQRLVSTLDWANTRRSFDGGRATYKGDVWTVDGFFLHPLNRNAANESKIDDANENVDFYGLYASRSDLAIGNMDVYYLGLDNSVGNYSYHTMGTRVFGTTCNDVMYDLEGGYQFGDNFDNSNHSAGFFTAGLGRQLNLCTRCGPWKPTVWMWWDFASGEENFANVNRGDDGFDHLFPLAHKYNGFMDLFGRRNLHDLNAQFITPFMSDKVKFLVWYHYFLLDELTTPYDVLMRPSNSVAAAGDRELGHEIDLLWTITLNPRNNVLLGYSYFSAGDYYDTTANVPTNQDAQFFYAQFTTRF